MRGRWPLSLPRNIDNDIDFAGIVPGQDYRIDMNDALERNQFLFDHTILAPLRRTGPPEPVDLPPPECCLNQNCYSINEACRALHLDCIKHFYEQRKQPVPTNVFDIFYSNMVRSFQQAEACAKYALANEFPMTNSTMNCIASFGNLEMLKKLHESGQCPAAESKVVLTNAVLRVGSLPCLKYLVENDLHDWGNITSSYESVQQTWLALVHDNYEELLTYMIQQGCRWSDFTLKAVFEGENCYDKLEFILGLGFVFTYYGYEASKKFESIAKSQPLDLLHYPKIREALRTQCVLTEHGKNSLGDVLTEYSCNYLKELLKKADDHLAAAKAAVEEQSGLPQDVVKHVVMGFL